MPLWIEILIWGSALLSTCSAARQQLSCDEFSKGTNFSSNQAVGVWYLLHLRPTNDPGDARCVQFFAVSDKERKDLQALIGKHVKDLKWDNLALKMQIPCVGDSGHNNKSRDYYLEKMDVDGSYKTLQMPSPKAKLELTDFNRHAMRLKLVEGKFLAMMDCVEHFTFLLDRQLHDRNLDSSLLQILQPYLPEQH